LEEAALTVAPRFRFGGMIFREKFCVDFSLIKKVKKTSQKHTREHKK
jgi:hypothetical protein